MAQTGGSVADEKKRLQEQGKFFEQGTGPDLNNLSDAWLGVMCQVWSESGKTFKCGFVGGDGYFETARACVETAMCLRFGRDKLLIQSGGILTAAAVCGTSVITRLMGSG